VAAKKTFPPTVVTKLAQARAAPVVTRALKAEDEFRPDYANNALGAGEHPSGGEPNRHVRSPPCDAEAV